MRFKLIPFSVTLILHTFIFLVLYNVNVDIEVHKPKQKFKYIESYNVDTNIMISNDIDSFLYMMAWTESRNNPEIYNSHGYIGKYQFGRLALKATGFSHVTLQKFIIDPSIWPESDQDIAMLKLMKLNEKGLKKFYGMTINGIYINKSGMLAAAHLAGQGNVRKYIRTNGTCNPKDSYGTSLESYILKFNKYNI